MDPRADRPPRNRELERMLIDVVRATEITAAARAEAWEVYADWLQSLGEPVGEWLAVSLRADDVSDAAAPVRAQLDEIERACSFRLVDLTLADLSEVPELARIADLTWERGFITRASVRTREFRPWDSELLEHTPDRLLTGILGSPSACLLHDLQIDTFGFGAIGSRSSSIAGLLAEFGHELPIRRFEFGHRAVPLIASERMFRWTPELSHLVVHSSEDDPIAPFVDQLARLLDERDLPTLRDLELRCRGAGDAIVAELVRTSLLERLRSVRIDQVGERGAELILIHADRFQRLDAVRLYDVEVPRPVRDKLIEIGCRIGRT